jgi:hypothetical protein
VKKKIKAILSGMMTYVPGYEYMRQTGGTISAKYCYSVWLRHLILASKNGILKKTLPRVVAELGPGDSIGIGLSALLSCAEKYHALDVVSYAKVNQNLTIFDELVHLFQNREPVPGEAEFSKMNPKLNSYEFPHYILNEKLLRVALQPERVARIRRSIEKPEDPYSMIQYTVPWDDPKVIDSNSIDMLYSQAVLEHVNDLPSAYKAMRAWVKPSGFISHQIDFGCHKKADTWNGHYTYSDIAWKLVVGKRPYLLNRETHSTHIQLLQQNGFKVVFDGVICSPSKLQRNQLARKFRDKSDDDLSIRGAFILAL